MSSFDDGDAGIRFATLVAGSRFGVELDGRLAFGMLAKDARIEILVMNDDAAVAAGAFNVYRDVETGDFLYVRPFEETTRAPRVGA